MSALPLGSGAGKLGDYGWIYALYELGQTAASSATPLQVQQDILEHIVSGFDAQSGSIALCVEGTEDLLEIAAGIDLPPGVIGSRLPRGAGVFGHVVATGEPLLINGDVAETGLPLRLHERRDRPTHSAMCWPLRVSERIIGAIAVNRAPGHPKYKIDDLDHGQAMTSLLALVIANHRMHVERANRIVELSMLNATMQRMNEMLEEAQDQLIQSEKMASIGQIAAGVAHEINNPIGYVLSNLGTLDSYLASLFGLLEAYIESERSSSAPQPISLDRARELRESIDFDFLRSDIVALLAESRDGILRVKHIVQDLKDFSRGGVDEIWEIVNLHEALDRTLNIVRNEVKYKARIETHYGSLPDVECLPSRLHQVFLNLIVNAGHAIEASGTITVSTGASAGEIWIRFDDTGCGMPKENLNRIFEPFFTTKPVGQGTGLGLSLSYSIVRRHGGRIDVESEVGRGSRFTIHLPVRQQRTQVTETEAAQVSAAVPV
ncbi:MAG TPA: ATP-binding protein [Casimicrobiaceae bacterium]|jgi:signal transduction histidine kinase|nr:ATP-binding protein [Casimicrobiaceae bacterium]